MVPRISITAGQPTILLPLGFVILVTMIKDIIEDVKRHMSDNRENNSMVLALKQPEQLRHNTNHESDPAEFQKIRWRHLRVGQIVKVLRNEYFPADILLLNSNDPQGI